MVLPQLSKTDHSWTLSIDGKPTILLGGQVHNSSTSEASWITTTFQKAKDLNFNFVIGSVNWNQFEPSEGTFDYALLAMQIKEAERNGLRLVVLWFGAFKNAVSTYAPSWVRKDKVRFPRAQKIQVGEARPGANQNPVLSIFSEDLLLADSKAFLKLMEYLRDFDKNNTVVMVQIENESGLLGSSRDYADEAEAKWGSLVPASLINGISELHLAGDLHAKSAWTSCGRRESGTWAEVFGDDWQAHEIFMAWHMGQYANTLAAQGKAVKNLPMYVNAWLGPQLGQTQAGQWPSGGPSANVIGIWKIAAPAIDMASPDIYIDDAFSVMADYDRPDNALFIPESRHVAGNLFWSLGNHGAIGYSMFGAERGRVGNQMSEAYGFLKEADQVISTAQAEGRIRAVVLTDGEMQTTLQFGELQVTANNSLGKLKRFVEFAGIDLEVHDFVATSEVEDGPVVIPSLSDARPFALVIQNSKTEFILIGKGINLEFESPNYQVEIDLVEEGRFLNNTWLPGRELNGDERLQFVPLHNIGCARIQILEFH